jgi:hypothetical protein
MGQEVQYKDHKGIVDFFDEHYIGICIKACEDRLRCVRVIVYSCDWDKVIINTDRT